ncbi:MAG: DUF302 domain-containing protein [Kiritimatiellae bacterium]|nr:DUF302 domain-containing protein [Kiritimatiellia bacterium]
MRWWSGFLTGALAVLAVAGTLTPRLMLRETESPLGLEETVAAITNAAVRAGWVVSSVLPMDETIRRHGGDPGRPVRVIKLCRADHAAAVLRDERARVVATLMPCSIAVYETASGVKIGTMNAALIGRLWGGTIARVMGGPVAREQAAFVRAASETEVRR